MKLVITILLLGALQLASTQNTDCISSGCNNQFEPNVVEQTMTNYIEKIDEAVKNYKDISEKNIGECIIKGMNLSQEVSYTLRKIQNDCDDDFSKVETLKNAFAHFKACFDTLQHSINSFEMRLNMATQLPPLMQMVRIRDRLRNSLFTMYKFDKNCDSKPVLNAIDTNYGRVLECYKDNFPIGNPYLTKGLCDAVDLVETTFCSTLQTCSSEPATDKVKCVGNALTVIQSETMQIPSNVGLGVATIDWTPLQNCFTSAFDMSQHFIIENYLICVENRP